MSVTGLRRVLPDTVLAPILHFAHSTCQLFLYSLFGVFFLLKEQLLTDTYLYKTLGSLVFT